MITGWICPKCGKVWAHDVRECKDCNEKEQQKYYYYKPKLEPWEYYYTQRYFNQTVTLQADIKNYSDCPGRLWW